MNPDFTQPIRREVRRVCTHDFLKFHNPVFLARRAEARAMATSLRIDCDRALVAGVPKAEVIRHLRRVANAANRKSPGAALLLHNLSTTEAQ